MLKQNRFTPLIAALMLAMTVAACDAMSGRETPGEYVDDTVITSQVIAGIVNDPSLTKSQVSVETLDNVVQLSGFVDSSQVAAKVGDIARNVAGVRAVRNNLVVQ